MKGIVVTSTVGITGKGKGKTGLTLICFNRRKKRQENSGAGSEITDGKRKECTARLLTSAL